MPLRQRKGPPADAPRATGRCRSCGNEHTVVIHKGRVIRGQSCPGPSKRKARVPAGTCQKHTGTEAAAQELGS